MTKIGHLDEKVYPTEFYKVLIAPRLGMILVPYGYLHTIFGYGPRTIILEMGPSPNTTGRSC
jgi:hypothetical protein